MCEDNNNSSRFQQQRDIVVAAKYLNFPVTTGAVKRRMQISIDGEIVREFDIELAPATPDFWVFLDVSCWQGHTLTLALESDSPGFAVVRQSENIVGGENLYHEALRPQFHFSARRGWLNDPNGLVYFQGTYHLFFQHNPYGCGWGNMHWGHAVSTDLLHWTELPIAIYPREYNDWAFSGSALVDVDNVANFQHGATEALLVFYTSTARGECLAHSLDAGCTFQEFPGNPVLRHQGRDPKVFWYIPGEHWVMVVYDERDDTRYFAIYTSQDLKHWQWQSQLAGFYECPELFMLPVDGDQHESRWVVYGADGQYLIGRFDGKTFTPESEKLPGNYGNCLYAAQTYNNIPSSDGRRIQIGWGRCEAPGMPFNQLMLFPVALSLHSTEAGLRLHATPVEEIKLLHEKTDDLPSMILAAGEVYPLAQISGELFDMRLELQVGHSSYFTLNLRGILLRYHAQQLECQGCVAPLHLQSDVINLQILLDRNVIEIFANDGAVYMPIHVIPAQDNQTFALECAWGILQVNSVEIHQLCSVWSVPAPSDPSYSI